MRIPGEGTDKLINRRQEAAVYQVIEGKHICDDIAYINPQNGYKITEFLEGARVCNPLNYEDVKKCMMRLHAFHDLKLKVIMSLIFLADGVLRNTVGWNAFYL